jgi:peptidylprolyl isomerase
MRVSIAPFKAAGASQTRPTPPRCSVSTEPQRNAGQQQRYTTQRRELLAATLGGVAFTLLSAGNPMLTASAEEEEAALCDAACVESLADKERLKTPSGLEYVDVVMGTGPAPPVGYQIVCNYVAMTPAGKVFDSSLVKGYPYEFRFGTGQVIPGLDEGILSMKVGGLRRLYIPGDLAFPKGLPPGPGRPRVPPASPVVFDVQVCGWGGGALHSLCLALPCYCHARLESIRMMGQSS